MPSKLDKAKNAIPPHVLTILGRENIKYCGIVEALTTAIEIKIDIYYNQKNINI